MKSQQVRISSISIVRDEVKKLDQVWVAMNFVGYFALGLVLTAVVTIALWFILGY